MDQFPVNISKVDMTLFRNGEKDRKMKLFLLAEVKVSRQIPLLLTIHQNCIFDYDTVSNCFNAVASCSSSIYNSWQFVRTEIRSIFRSKCTSF
jgi:hypothetical protein